MRNSRLPWRLLYGLAAFLVLSTSLLRGQIVDLNGNGISDVWELIFEAGSLDPQGDAVRLS